MAFMPADPSSAAASDVLPARHVERLTEPIARFLRIEALAGVLLLLATILAVGIANSPWAERFLAFWATPIGIRLGSAEIAYSLRHIINDGLMTLFFFVVGLEIKREFALGELRDRRTAAFPAAAALGGMVVPVALYLSLQAGEAGERGWGVVMATDIAFVVGCLALLGSRVPPSLRIFVLSLAIIDDIGAILVIAVGYTAEIDLVALGLGAVGIGGVLALRYLGVRSVPVYYFTGILTWFAVHESGVHATIIGVILGLLTPVHPWIGAKRFLALTLRLGDYWRGAPASPPADDHAHVMVQRTVALAARETLSPLVRLEMTLHPWVNFIILPLFALANAGVVLSPAGLGEPVALAVIVGLALGKPLGVLGATYIAVRSGIAIRPPELNWPIIGAAGVLAGIGFTMALFIANLAFPPALIEPAKLGIMGASGLCAVIGLTLLIVSLPPRERPRP